MRILSCVAAAIVLATASLAASADDRDADSWPTLGRDWKQSYYSPLTGINADNIAQLGYAWGYDLQFTSTLEATPIVIDGVMYFPGRDRVEALEADTGKQVWGTTNVTGLKFGASIHLTPNGDATFLFTDEGNLIIAQLNPERYREISRVHLIEPTYQFGGRKVVWPLPAFANQHVFARNDKELICASLEAKP